MEISTFFGVSPLLMHIVNPNVKSLADPFDFYFLTMAFSSTFMDLEFQ